MWWRDILRVFRKDRRDPPGERPPYIIQFEMSTGRSQRELPSAQMVLQEYDLLKAAGAARITITDGLGNRTTPQQLRALIGR